jgi:6-phosphogluconolactonase
MSIDIQIVEDPAQACADVMSTAVATGENVVLAGGSTPRRAYQLAVAQQPQQWQSAKLWFSDERCVEPDSELSNFRMVKESLLDPLERVGVVVEFCRRILGERGHEEAGIEYERELEHVGGGPGAIRFELVTIGIGSDGHVCSMFPRQRSLSERSRLALGVPEAGLEPFVPRVTLTFQALSRAKRVVVLATGAGKADAIAAAFAQDASPTPDVPASLLAEHVEDVVVLVDKDAAAKL